MRTHPRHVLAVIVATALALSLALASGATAQGSAPGPLCSILTTDELAAAMATEEQIESGIEWEVRSDYWDCRWERTGVFDGPYLALLAEYRLRSIDGSRDRDITGTEAEVAGNGAWFMEGLRSLDVDLPNGGSLALTFTGGQSAVADLEAVLVGLAELALPRLAELALPSPEPGPTPAPSFAGDAELEALFPIQIAGEAVTVQSMGGDGLVAQLPQDRIDALTQAVASQGKTIADVSFAGASTSVASIGAIRVRGADAAALAPALISFYSGGSDPQQTPATVAGKQVIRLTAGPPTDDPSQTSAYAYPKNDVLWIVVAAEPPLTEILEKLP